MTHRAQVRVVKAQLVEGTYLSKGRLHNSRRRAKRGGYLPVDPTTVLRPEPVDGLCELCGYDQHGHGKSFELDHDHTTGRFRAWLCSHCNRVIGRVEALGLDVVSQFLLKGILPRSRIMEEAA